MNILKNNPYRLLGVYANSPTKERLANHNRMKAFLKVGKKVSFPLDLSKYLSAIKRTESMVADAEAKLTLPKDQMLYAQFWFVKVTPLDDVAFKHLTAGEIAKAEEIWQKKACASSLQNRIVCALTRKDYACAVSCAEALYGNTLYVNQLVSAVVGAGGGFEVSSLAFSFLDVLCEEVGANKLLPFVTNPTWKNHIAEKAVKPLIDNIQNAIAVAQKSKGDGSKAQYDAGQTLMKSTQNALSKLKKILAKSDLQYQVIADKLGLEILQCGIDYFNGSEEPDAAHKAMSLQKYAYRIVVGQMAKDRCKENVDILQKIIDELPPAEVMENHRAILSYLTAFAIQPNLIKYSIQLIRACASHIVVIKEKLGSDNQYYLQISTQIVNNALGNVIAEVNEAQEKKDFEILKPTLISAWRAQLYMDKFDLLPEYKAGRFHQSRNALYDIISNCKGFEDIRWSSIYRYGCGWCNNLDCSDVDLRTDDEFYSSCYSLRSFKDYLKRFPSGKYVTEAKEKIEELTFKSATTIEDLDKFIQQYPKSKYVLKAKEKKEELLFKKCKTTSDFQKFINNFPTSTLVTRAKEEILNRQEKVLFQCKSTKEVCALYTKEKHNGIDVDICSLRAFELCKMEDDYRKVIATFGDYTSGGKKALLKIVEIEEENAKFKKHFICFLLFLTIIIVIIYLIWGLGGMSIVCYVFASIFTLLALVVYFSINGCASFVLGVIAYGLFALGRYLGNLP